LWRLSNKKKARLDALVLGQILRSSKGNESWVNKPITDLLINYGTAKE